MTTNPSVPSLVNGSILILSVLFTSACGEVLDVVGYLETPLLNLQMWNPGDPSQGKELRLAGRITNYSSSAILVDRLSIKVWFYYNGTSPLEWNSFENNQAIFNSQNDWIANLNKTSVTLNKLDQVRTCSSSRRANWVATITFPSDENLQLPGEGAYVQCNRDENTLATFHREDWSPLDPSQDYSRISDAGTTAATRKDLPQYTLYLDDVLVTEVLGLAKPDSNTGIEPCP